MGTKLCILCRENKAELPDRYRAGRIKRVCRKCHAARLTNDLRDLPMGRKKT
jgi:hypothetical protein